MLRRNNGPGGETPVDLDQLRGRQERGGRLSASARNKNATRRLSPEQSALAMKVESALAPKLRLDQRSGTGQFLLGGSWEVLFKPGSPHWLLPFCNAFCIVPKEEKSYGQVCHLAHPQGEEVCKARRGLVQPDHQFGMVLRPCSFDDALQCLRARRCDHAPLFSRICQAQGFNQLSPSIG